VEGKYLVVIRRRSVRMKEESHGIVSPPRSVLPRHLCYGLFRMSIVSARGLVLRERRLRRRVARFRGADGVAPRLSLSSAHKYRD